MRDLNPASDRPAQPDLADLLARYLQRQLVYQAAGIGEAKIGEVVPFEAVAVQPVDAQLAWRGALAALGYFHPQKQAIKTQMPADWPSLVSTREPAAALAFCFGNFPQMVRNLHPLLHAKRLSELRPPTGSAVEATIVAKQELGNGGAAFRNDNADLVEWATLLAGQRKYPEILLALGVLRVAAQFDMAVELIGSHRSVVPSSWQAAWANEEASLTWHRGQAEEAAELWQSQAASVPVLFNRGMAALFLDKPTEARRWLNQAVTELPEDEPWHHLGRLYLALAEMRS